MQNRRIPFTKMHGAGNDFIVLDETKGSLGLAPRHYQWLAHRHYGVGADQILTILPAASDAVDFGYRIHNADGAEVEHCGNGARCFVRYVHAKGLSDKNPLRVQTQKSIIELSENSTGEVCVDMGRPFFELADIPFKPEALPDARPIATPNAWQRWRVAGQEVTVLSMGNPHAVLLTPDIEQADVATLAPQIQASKAFPQGVNVGFMEIVNRNSVRLRVFERGVGETLACGTGACAAVVSGIRLGLLAETVLVHTRGGPLRIEWPAGTASPLNLQAAVAMHGGAEFVFDAEVTLPEALA